MAINQKYELLSHEDEQQRRAKHVRLGREVYIYRIEKGSDPQRHRAIRMMGSQLANLDHPRIPHLIDFIDDEEAYHLVWESHPPRGRSLPGTTGDLLASVAVFERVADALCHARQRGLAMGNLDAQCLTFDQQGELKIVGIGLRQCEYPEEHPEPLFVQDLERLRAMVDNVATVADEDDDETVQQKNELRAIVGSTETDICQFSDEIRTWLNQQLSLRAARELDFESRSKSSQPAITAWTTSLLAACVVAGVIISAVVIYALWPPNTNDVADASNAPTPTVEPPSNARLWRADSSAFDSDSTSVLGNVGKLNNPNSAHESAVSANQTGDPTTEPALDSNSEKSANSEPEPEPPEPPEPVLDSPTERAVGGDDLVPKRTTSPFAEQPDAIDLPTINNRDAATLLSTGLREDEPLLLHLVGGTGAYKQGTFLMLTNEPGSWHVVFEHNGEEPTIAQLEFIDQRLRFQWTTNASGVPAANHLANTILVVKSGEWTHDLALRSVTHRPAFKVELERNKPFELDLDNPPQWDNVFIEFIPSPDSLAQASPMSSMPAKDGELTIGLDAGGKSLVILQLESISRGKIRTTGWARETKSDPRQQIKKGFQRNLKIAMQRLSQNLFTLKTAVKTLKGKDAAQRRKRAEAMIKKLEERKQIGEAFRQSYLAAKATTLQLNVYRKLGERKLILLRLGHPDQ